MENKLNLRILTRQRTFVEEKVDEVYIPAKTGEIGILPGHRPLLALLGIGILHFSKGEEKEKIGICGGIAEVINDEVKILVEEILNIEEKSEEEILKEIQKAEEILKISSGKEQERAKNQIKKCQTILKLKR